MACEPKQQPEKRVGAHARGAEGADGWGEQVEREQERKRRLTREREHERYSETQVRERGGHYVISTD